MPSSSSGLISFLRKLETHSALSEAERQVVMSLPYRTKSVAAHTHLFREGEPATSCCVLLDGYACRYKLVVDGSRQILAVLMRGDAVDLQGALLGRADHGVEMLTRGEVAYLPVATLEEMLASHPRIARAFWVDTVLDTAVQREWTVNVGRRDARQRLAHLLCELAVREMDAGLGRRDRFELPLTQAQLADCTGLTSVHVNRVLQALRAEGVVSSNARTVVIEDWGRITALAGFRPDYLRVAGTAADRGGATQG